MKSRPHLHAHLRRDASPTLPMLKLSMKIPKILLFVLFCLACQSAVFAQTLFSDATNAAVGMPQHSIIAVVDVNNDGVDDLVVNAQKSGTDSWEAQLWKRQSSGFNYTNATAGSGLQGLEAASAGDFNNDGFIDFLHINGNRTEAAIYRNSGNGTFTKVALPLTESTALFGFQDSVRAVDIDGDGDLDLVFGKAAGSGGSIVAVLNQSRNGGSTSQPFSGLTTLAVTSWIHNKADITDANGDGKTDFLSIRTAGNWSSGTHPDFPVTLFLNTGNSTADYLNPNATKSLAGFTQRDNCGISAANVMSPLASWDIDNDGDLDLINGSSDWPSVSRPHIYINDGSGNYTQSNSPVYQSTNYYHHGISIFDADLDNDMDAVWTALHNFANMNPRMWRNDGNLAFSDATTAWGINVSIGSGNLGMSGYHADLDGDGDIDFVVDMNNGWGSEKIFRIFKNNAVQNGSNWLGIKLVSNTSAPNGIGARVEVTANGKKLTQYMADTTGGVRNLSALRFGLGSATKADSVKVYWPSGQVTEFNNVSGNQILNISEGGNLPDSDGDGVTDYREIKDGTDPNNINSFNPLSKGLVAYYPFNGNAKDESGNGKNGEIVGNVISSSDRFGNINKSYAFDGASGTIAAGNSGLTEAVGNFTLSTWIKAIEEEPPEPESIGGTSFAHKYVIGGVWGGDSSAILIAAGTNGVSILEHGDNHLPVVLSFASQINNKWVQLVVTCSNNAAPVLYLDGKLVRTGLNSGRSKISSVFASQNQNQSNIEGIGGGNYGRFKGDIDDVRLYNRALSAAEVAQLYTKESENPNMVTVQGGTLPQGSELAGQSVRDFQIGKYEMTWGEWKAVRDWAVANGYTDLAGVGVTYPGGSGDNFPVVNVSWYDVVKWCNAKSEMEGLAPVYQVGGVIYKTGQSVPTVNSMANGYRLPMEKEWEWAASGGVKTHGYTYSGSNDANDVMWTWEYSAGAIAVGTKVGNELGVYDMSGNIVEWCWDAADSSNRRARGGNWTDLSVFGKVFSRAYSTAAPDIFSIDIGFRLARNAVSLVSLPEISLEQPPRNSLQNSQTISFGNVVTGNSQSLAFTIKNTGTAPLTGLYISNYGWEIQVDQLPSDTLAPGGNMTFTATFTPYGWNWGPSSSTVEIYSNDPTVNPFTITLTGNGLSYWMDSDGDGMSDAEEYSLWNLGFDWQEAQPELVSAYHIQMNLPPGELKMTSGKVLPFELSAAGGTGPFVWEKTSGNLPPGVTMGSNGTLTGTPTAAGKYQFTLKVANAEGFSATRQVTLRIIPNATFGGGYNFAHFAGRMFGFMGSGDSSGTFTGSGVDSGGFTGSSDGSSSFTGSADFVNLKPAVHGPSGVAVDASGNIYVSDSANNQIRKISATGAISNVAGVFTGSGGKDGTAWNARFNNPQGMATDASGNVYVADQDNHAIRKITPNRAVSTVAGSFTGSGAAGFSGSADGGVKTTARFNKPADVAVDAAGNIYVADSGNHAIRKISTTGSVTTLAGTMGAVGNINASGASARFRSPQGIAVDGNGTVYVADTGNQVIRRITASGTVSTFAGAAFTGSASPLGGRASFTGSAHAAFIGSADSTNLPASVDGNASTARFSYPTDITIDSAGILYVTDSGTEKIRKITANGTVTTLGGSPDGFFYNPLAVAAGANGTLYVADAGNNRIARGIPGASAIAAPVIIAKPTDFLNVYGNTPANFSVIATGGNLTYQWYRNGIPVSGANSPTLLRTASLITEGTYTVAVSNVLATEVSEPATLSLRPPAEWTWGQTGTEQSVQPGDSMAFSVDNVTGPGGAISYQWLRNGKPLPGKTSPTLMLSSVGLGDGGNYALVITTAAGKVTTETQTLVVEDRGALVYKLRGTSSAANASGKESSKLEGYLVRDRTNNYSYFFWLWPTTKGGGGNKTYSFESRSDITEKSTGPFSGSTSVLRANAEAGVETITSSTTIYPDGWVITTKTVTGAGVDNIISNTTVSPDGSVVTEETVTPALLEPNEEMVWISGTDSLITLSPSLKTLAPATMTGQINATYDDEGIVIDMTNITLNLDRPQTLKARTIDENDISNTLNRLMQEIESKGYQLTN